MRTLPRRRDHSTGRTHGCGDQADIEPPDVSVVVVANTSLADEAQPITFYGPPCPEQLVCCADQQARIPGRPVQPFQMRHTHLLVRERVNHVDQRVIGASSPSGCGIEVADK